MALTKEDLAKIEAMVTALFELYSARLEQRIDLRFQIVFDELQSLRNEIEAVKKMLTEDVTGAYERIDQLEARVKKLEGQVAALA